MPIVSFQNPTDVPVYAGWDFPVFAARIRIDLDFVLPVINRVLAWEQKYVKNRASSGTQILASRLAEAAHYGSDVDLGSSQTLWALASDLFFEKRFIDTTCPQCQKTYPATACSVAGWVFGSGLAAEWGRRVICPAGHTQYACPEGES